MLDPISTDWTGKEAAKWRLFRVSEYDALVEENARQRACLSWITGACVDEAPYADISAAIDRCVTPLMFAKDEE